MSTIQIKHRYTGAVLYEHEPTDEQPDSFDENWMDECSHGVHFFITRLEAEAY